MVMEPVLLIQTHLILHNDGQPLILKWCAELFFLPLFVRERRTEASFEPCLRNFEGRPPRSGELGGDSGSFTNTLGGCRSKGVRSSQSKASGFSGGLLRPRFISSMGKDASGDR